MTDMAQQKSADGTLAPESPPDYELHNLPARPAQTYQRVTGNAPYSMSAQGERNPGATITHIENTVDLESGQPSAQEAQQAAQEEQNSEQEAPKAQKGSLRSRVPRGWRYVLDITIVSLLLGILVVLSVYLVRTINSSVAQRSQVSTGPADEEIWLDGLEYGYGMGRENIPK